MNKKILLIGGNGTLGTYTAKELSEMGHSLDIICLEDNQADTDRIKYYKATANINFLNEFLKDKYYDGIVNFILYEDVNEYKPIHKILSGKTDHLIFLSSYRVYADLQHPITETAPQLFDVSKDEDFLKNEKYAVSKSKAEYFIREESGTTNWTIVRPVISFSDKRFDIVTRNGREVIDRTKNNEIITLPEVSRNLTAGLDWAGNSGKLIANLLFKESALGEAYTVSSAQNLTWGEVANIYTELLGAKFKWVSTEEFVIENPYLRVCPWILKYDRFFDRQIDNKKILSATGLKKDNFASIKDGIITELHNLGL